MKPDADYSLYVLTDRDLMLAPSIEESVERAIVGGCTLVQVREKRVSSREFFQMASRVKAAAGRYGVPVIVNDRADIAMAVGASGVHVGQSDLPPDTVRGIIGPDMILGVSVSSPGEAVAAIESGADYLGVGAMFATGTKEDAEAVSMETLREIRALTSLPIVVIGGINRDTAPRFEGTGVDGLAVVSAVVGAADIEAAARELRQIVKSWGRRAR